jgi:hypothetical protein
MIGLVLKTSHRETGVGVRVPPYPPNLYRRNMKKFWGFVTIIWIVLSIIDFIKFSNGIPVEPNNWFHQLSFNVFAVTLAGTWAGWF